MISFDELCCEGKGLVEESVILQGLATGGRRGRGARAGCE